MAFKLPLGVTDLLQMCQEPRVFMQRKEYLFLTVWHSEQIDMLQVLPKLRRTLGWANIMMCFLLTQEGTFHRGPKHGPLAMLLHVAEGSWPDGEGPWITVLGNSGPRNWTVAGSGHTGRCHVCWRGTPHCYFSRFVRPIALELVASYHYCF